MGQPDAFEAEVGLLGNHVVVVVVVQYAQAVAVGERGDEQVDGREAVMSDARELSLGVEGTLLRNVVEVVLRECLQLG